MIIFWISDKKYNNNLENQINDNKRTNTVRYIIPSMD